MPRSRHLDVDIDLRTCSAPAMIELVISVVIGTVLLTAMLIQVRRNKKASDRGKEQLRLAIAEGQTVPLSLHPVIDPTLCVGSFSCIKACPEGEIIGVVDGVATLVEAAHCIGHGTCATECPVGAIRLVFGTAEMGIDLPKADESFESSRPGVFIIGELGGMGLIKNALRQGLVVGGVLKEKLKKSQATQTMSDVVIVGGGPAGIACAVACREAGLDVRILEQETLGGAIAHYPRGKVVMTEQIEMPGFGAFGKSLLSKEELLTDLRRLVDRNGVHIEEGQRVTGILGDAPQFTVVTESGSVGARAVVLAIGLRGTPRKLDVPGEELSKVTYRLVDPEQYHGKRVLVVGGGDSAVEAAIQLAEESTAKVTISYRQDRFNRVKARNREKIARLIEEGRVKAAMKTRVVSIDQGTITLGHVLDDAEIARRKREEEERKTREQREAERRLAERDRAKAEDDLRAKSSSGKRPAPIEEKETFDPDVTDPQGDRITDKPLRPRSVTGGFRVKPIQSVEAPDDEEGTPTLTEGEGVGAKKEKTRTEKKKAFDKSSVTGSFRARALDAVSDPAIKTVGPAEVRARTSDTSSKLRRRDSTPKEPKEQKEKTRTMMAPVAALTPAEPEKAKEPGEQRIKNDAVIISIGGQMPTQFLKSVGVGTRNYKGEERTGVKAMPGDKKLLSKAQVEARSRRRLAMTLTLIGAAIIIGLVLIGEEYYWLEPELRSQSPLHSLLKPSGLWGHGVGVAATTFMIANFLYALRKRWRKLKGTASIRTWLTFHMFVGIMSPLVIAFHAAFLSQNLLAVWTWIALSVVVGTGIFGRFLFSFVPAQAGKVMAVAELREKVSESTRVVQRQMAEAKDLGKVANILDRASDGPRERTMVGVVLKDMQNRRELEKKIDEARALFVEERAFKQYKEGVLEIDRAKMQLTFYAALKRIFRMWLVVHVVVALFMVVLIGAHVAVTTYLGFTWIFGDH